jgi:ATP-dependent protease HslVU (ClpYQ) peptidase subunit
MKSALRVVALFLTAVIGLWVIGHGIALAVSIRQLVGENQDILSELVESSVSIAGGICVVSVAVEQLNCLRTHRKEDSLI